VDNKTLLSASVFDVGARHTISATPNLWFWAALTAPITLSVVLTWCIYTFWLGTKYDRCSVPENKVPNATRYQPEPRGGSLNKTSGNSESNLASGLLSQVLEELNNKALKSEESGSDVPLHDEVRPKPMKAMTWFQKTNGASEGDIERGRGKSYTA